MSDKIIVMKEGDIAQQGAPESLYHAPNSVFIADFMGEANILPCEVEQVEGSEWCDSAGSAIACAERRRDRLRAARSDRSSLPCTAVLKAHCAAR